MSLVTFRSESGFLFIKLVIGFRCRVLESLAVEDICCRVVRS